MTRPESGAVEADGHVERRRLAGAVRPEQADDLARRDVEAHAAHDRAPAVGLGEIVRPERRHSLRVVRGTSPGHRWPAPRCRRS